MSTLYPDLTGTNFPNDLDTFLNYINITATDAPLIVQYVEAMRNGDYTGAQNILQQIPNATRKIIQAADLNKLSEAILALERFFKTDIQPYITEKQEEWQNIIDRFSYKGTWNSSTSYSVNNMVSYTIGTNEFIYIATGNPPIGTVPTNSQYWRLLTIQGQQGQSGPGWSYRQEWNSAVQYNTDNVVSYEGILYQALRDTLGEQPDITPSAWKEVVQISAASYPIQPTEPANQQPGDLWFNTSTTPTQYIYLQPLDNPASASEIVNGYEAYDETGTKVVGTANYLPLSGGTMASNAVINWTDRLDIGDYTQNSITFRPDGLWVNNPNGNLQLGDTSKSIITLNEIGISYISKGAHTFTGGNLVAMENKITRVADPTDPQDVATKNYVDTHSVSGDFLPLTGGTMNGPINMTSNLITFNNGNLNLSESGITGLSNYSLDTFSIDLKPTTSYSASMFLYPSQSRNEFVKFYAKTGTGLSDFQSISFMRDGRIEGVSEPTKNTDVANKQYVDQISSNHKAGIAEIKIVNSGKTQIVPATWVVDGTNCKVNTSFMPRYRIQSDTQTNLTITLYGATPSNTPGFSTDIYVLETKMTGATLGNFGFNQGTTTKGDGYISYTATVPQNVAITEAGLNDVCIFDSRSSNYQV